MFRFVLPLCLTLMSTPSVASNINDYNQSCLKEKYQAYIDASVSWYENLINEVVEKHPDLKAVSDWFLEGRYDHFKLKQMVFTNYLSTDPDLLHLNKPVESWLNLTQEDIKSLSLSQSNIKEMAKKVYEFRQGNAQQGNYELRSALADLLKNPQNIEEPLNRYNDKMQVLTDMSCAND